MAISVQQVINRCRLALIDPTPWTYWSDQELLGHFNNGVAAVVQVDKKASVVNGSFQLTAGTKQTLPADATALIRPVRNMGADGATPGRAIRMIDMELMNAVRPRWHMDPASMEVRNAMADAEDPRRWYNWPPSDGSNYVEIKYDHVPNDSNVAVFQCTAGANAGVNVIQLSNTAGIAVGQMLMDLSAFFVAPPNQPGYPAMPPSTSTSGTTVTAITPNASVTLSMNLQGAIAANDWVSFSDAFPLPELYADPVYHFVMAYALDKNSRQANPGRSQDHWQKFMTLLSSDFSTIQNIGIGAPDH